MGPEMPQEKRRFERYPIYCPIEYKTEDASPKESSTTLNISEGGALISAGRELPVSSILIIKLKLKDETFFMISKVRHIRQARDGDICVAGIEFWNRPAAFIEKFYDELDAIMDYRRRLKEDEKIDISLAEASLNWYK